MGEGESHCIGASRTCSGARARECGQQGLVRPAARGRDGRAAKRSDRGQRDSVAPGRRTRERADGNRLRLIQGMMERPSFSSYLARAKTRGRAPSPFRSAKPMDGRHGVQNPILVGLGLHLCVLAERQERLQG